MDNDHLTEDEQDSLDNQPESRLKKGLILKEFLENKQTEFEVYVPESDKEECPYYSDDEVVDFVNPVMLDEYDEDDESGKSLFEKYAEKMEDVSGDGGVLKKIVSVGSGEKAMPGSVVVFHYRSYLEHSHEPFDSSRLRNNPSTIRLGSGAALPGMEIALLTMQVREVSQFLLLPDYAYGKMGCPPRIPGDATVFYEIELVEVVDYDAAIKYDQLTPAEKEVAQFDKKMAATKAEQKAGKRYFKQNQYYKALGHYKKAIGIQERCNLRDEADQDASSKVLLSLYVSAAITCAKLDKDQVKVMTYCNKALELDPNNVKALYWKGQAKVSKGDYLPGRRLLEQARRLEPHNSQILLALQQLEEKKAKAEQEEILQYSPMFKTGSSDAVDPHSARVKDLAAEVESLYLGVSDEFKLMTEQQLQIFDDDHRRSEMSFPSSISFKELEYLDAQCLDRKFKVLNSVNGLGETELTITKTKI